MAYDNQKIYLDNREKKCRLVENNISNIYLMFLVQK